MGKFNSLSITVMFSAIFGLLLGTGYLISESDAQAGPLCFGSLATPGLLGTPGRDKIHGTGADEVLIGLGGNDRITGGGGDDKICGGDGNDFLIGGDGEDKIDGGPGEDAIISGNDSDMIFAQDGEPDRILAGDPKAGSDVCTIDPIEEEKKVRGCEIIIEPYGISGP